METLRDIFICRERKLVKYHDSILTFGKTIDEIGKESEDILYLSDENFNLRYINPTGCRWFGKSKANMVGLRDKFVNEYYHPDTIKFEFPKIKAYYQQEEQDMVYSNFQRVFNPIKRTYAICFVFIKKIKTMGFLFLILPLDNHIVLNRKVKRLICEETFRDHHFDEFNQLTDREYEVFKLLARGLNNPDISKELCISRHTVEVHRKNINKKLKIHNMKDVLEYAYAFDLV